MKVGSPPWWLILIAVLPALEPIALHLLLGPGPAWMGGVANVVYVTASIGKYVSMVLCVGCIVWILRGLANSNRPSLRATTLLLVACVFSLGSLGMWSRSAEIDGARARADLAVASAERKIHEFYDKNSKLPDTLEAAHSETFSGVAGAPRIEYERLPPLLARYRLRVQWKELKQPLAIRNGFLVTNAFRGMLRDQRPNQPNKGGTEPPPDASK